MAAVAAGAMAGVGPAIADLEGTYAANTAVQAVEARLKIRTLAQKFAIDTLIV